MLFLRDLDDCEARQTAADVSDLVALVRRMDLDAALVCQTLSEILMTLTVLEAEERLSIPSDLDNERRTAARLLSQPHRAGVETGRWLGEVGRVLQAAPPPDATSTDGYAEWYWGVRALVLNHSAGWRLGGANDIGPDDAGADRPAAGTSETGIQEPGGNTPPF